MMCLYNSCKDIYKIYIGLVEHLSKFQMGKKGSRLTLIRKYPKCKKNMMKEMYRSNMAKYMLDTNSQLALDNIYRDRSRSRFEVFEWDSILANTEPSTYYFKDKNWEDIADNSFAYYKYHNYWSNKATIQPEVNWYQ